MTGVMLVCLVKCRCERRLKELRTPSSHVLGGVLRLRLNRFEKTMHGFVRRDDSVAYVVGLELVTLDASLGPSPNGRETWSRWQNLRHVFERANRLGKNVRIGLFCCSGHVRLQGCGPERCQ